MHIFNLGAFVENTQTPGGADKHRTVLDNLQRLAARESHVKAANLRGFFSFFQNSSHSWHTTHNYTKYSTHECIHIYFIFTVSRRHAPQTHMCKWASLTAWIVAIFASIRSALKSQNSWPSPSAPRVSISCNGFPFEASRFVRDSSISSMQSGVGSYLTEQWTFR